MRLVNRTFDELCRGDVSELRRLVTADDLYVFAAASGNYNPMHLTDSDLDGNGQAERVAPGMFVASLISAVLGTQLPGAGTLYRRQVLDFHARAHAGEELVCRVEVLEKLADGAVRLSTTITRATDGALILSGEAEVTAPTQKFDRDDIEVPGLIVQRHRHFEALLERAKPLPALPTAVVCPDDANSLGGALLAMREGIITPILIGAADAIRDGDHIWAILKGSAVNNDGAAKAGYLAPSVEGQARCIAGRGGKPDEVHARTAQSRAEFRVFLGRNIDANDAIDARLHALRREPFRPANGHRVGIAHEDKRRLRMPRTERSGGGENVGGGRPLGKAAQVRRLNRWPIGHRVGEWHTKFDHVRARRDQRVEISGGIAIARRDKTHERGVGAGEGLG